VKELAGQSAGKGYLAVTLRGTIVSEALVGRGSLGIGRHTNLCWLKKLSIRDKGLSSGGVLPLSRY
jgi:hypothetical protein